MSVIIPKCSECKHFLTENSSDPLYCKAYPNGIPTKLFWHGNHEEGNECNNGYSFEPELKATTK